MQDVITVPPKHQLQWLRAWKTVLEQFEVKRTPYVITGSHGSYYRYHDWFWNIGSQQAGNDNVLSSHRR